LGNRRLESAFLNPSSIDIDIDIDIINPNSKEPDLDSFKI
jgi:hypothetical protein